MVSSAHDGRPELPTAELSELRQSQDRVLEREGIPMMLALVDETGRAVSVSDPTVIGAGRSLADRLDGYRGALVPSSRDDDMGCLISVLQVLAYADFGAPPETLPDAAQIVARQEVGQESGL